MCDNCGYDNTREKMEHLQGPVTIETCVRCGHKLREPVQVPGKSNETAGSPSHKRGTLLD